MIIAFAVINIIIFAVEGFMAMLANNNTDLLLCAIGVVLVMILLKIYEAEF